MNLTENVSSIIACSFVAREIVCPQSCSLATAVVLSPVYVAVTWQRVCMSQYLTSHSIHGALHDLIKSCIMHRTQQIHIRKGIQLRVRLFKSLPVMYGVPQGSILSHLLLIINVCDFSKWSRRLRINPEELGIATCTDIVITCNTVLWTSK
jgi:hypothetical protein